MLVNILAICSDDELMSDGENEGETERELQRKVILFYCWRVRLRRTMSFRVIYRLLLLKLPPLVKCTDFLNLLTILALSVTYLS